MEKLNSQKILETKDKITSLLRIRGPSLPVHMASATGLSLLLSSTLLSELIRENKVKVSHMKVGGSPVYFLPGQELRLERYQDYIKGKEKEALMLLKQKQVLREGLQLPAIRVALRNLKDFAFHFFIDEKMYWRYFTISEQEAREKLKAVIKEIEIKPRLKLEEKPKIPEKLIKEEPILKLKKVKEKKPIVPSNFVIKILKLLEDKNIEVLEKIDMRKREFTGKVRINSDIGKIEFLAIAKDKKSVTENDLAVGSQKAQNLKLPLLFINQGKLNKKAQTYIETWRNYIKTIMTQ